ncbi:MAG: hypothetical protein V1738_01815 [Patescibacteria group bacterium]
MSAVSQKIGLVGNSMAVFAFLQFFIYPLTANAMSSTNFSVENDTLNFGGGAASSETFEANDTLGDVSTSEDLTSENFGGCAGFQCYSETDFLSFSVRQGTTSPGTPGAGVNLGSLDTSIVSTSNGTSVNSIYITADANSDGGLQVTVTSQNSGLARISSPSTKITSSSGTLVPGTEGFGICVESVTQGDTSPTLFTAASPYNNACNKSTSHQVGLVDLTSRVILGSTGYLRGGQAEILVKAAISTITPAGDDYSDTLTFTAVATY